MLVRGHVPELQPWQQSHKYSSAILCGKSHLGQRRGGLRLPPSTATMAGSNIMNIKSAEISCSLLPIDWPIPVCVGPWKEGGGVGMEGGVYGVTLIGDVELQFLGCRLTY